MTSSPRLSIGLPVYNGESFLKAALDSILNQTYKDFELIISDNGSTDKTEDICRSYMLEDQRIRYYRNNNNLGAAWNFNRVFSLSNGQYFKWAAHDDVCANEFLERCVDVLERDLGVIVCFSKTMQIDEQGNIEKKRDHIDLPNLSSSRSDKRFHDIIINRHGCESVFGVIRTSVLRKTPLIGNYIASDRVLLALLSIYGRFYELPEYLFFQREHMGRSVKGKDHEVTLWFDPKRGKKIVFPCWRIFLEYFKIAITAPPNFNERLRCLWQIVKWTKINWLNLKWDLSSGIDRALLLRQSRPIYRQMKKWILSGRLRIPSWLATSLALSIILVVEVFYWAFKIDRKPINIE